MLDCLIIGDSIAVGTQHFKPECRAVAKGGINSYQWNQKNSNQSLGAQVVVISLGSNDHSGVRTLWELQQIRSRVHADRVYWILPAIKPDIQKMVQMIADDYGDMVLPIKQLQPDRVHPSWAGYRQLAEQIK